LLGSSALCGTLLAQSRAVIESHKSLESLFVVIPVSCQQRRGPTSYKFVPLTPSHTKHTKLTMSDASPEDISNEDEHDDSVIILTADEILKHGLHFIGYTSKRIKKAKRRTNLGRFKGHFGSSPRVIAQIWEDLQRTNIPEAFVPVEKQNFNHFLMSMHHLKRYPTELEREAIFDISLSQGRDAVWYFVEKIQALKAVKISWPEFGAEAIWVITVDGQHCWIQEPQHETWSQDKDYYSHKYGKAGVCYELGISLTESRLVWMNGPFKAGESDQKIFKNRGLKAKLKAIGKKGIADGGYTGHPNQLSTPNNRHDATPVKKFKSRALKRHETFNGLTKFFDCLSGRFRHSVDRFKNCFEAVCVICQYQVELGNPLYDILIPDLIED
jgi:hypothetical protein